MEKLDRIREEKLIKEKEQEMIKQKELEDKIKKLKEMQNLNRIQKEKELIRKEEEQKRIQKEIIFNIPSFTSINCSEFSLLFIIDIY